MRRFPRGEGGPWVGQPSARVDPARGGLPDRGPDDHGGEPGHPGSRRDRAGDRGGTGYPAQDGVVAGLDRGRASAGAIVGDSIGFYLGHRFGRNLFDWLGRKFPRHFGPGHVALAERVFTRYGAWAVFFGRFIALLRIFAGPLAGSLRMPYPKFLAANACGGIVWATGLTYLIWFLGVAAEKWLSRVSWLGLVAAVLVGLVITLLIRRKTRSLTREAEAGPKLRPRRKLRPGGAYSGASGDGTDGSAADTAGTRGCERAGGERPAAGRTRLGGRPAGGRGGRRRAGAGGGGASNQGLRRGRGGTKPCADDPPMPARLAFVAVRPVSAPGEEVIVYGLDHRFGPQVRAAGGGAGHRADRHRDRPAALRPRRRLPGVHAAVGGDPDRGTRAVGGRGGAADHVGTRAGPAQRRALAGPHPLVVDARPVRDRPDVPAAAPTCTPRGSRSRSG